MVVSVLKKLSTFFLRRHSHVRSIGNYSDHELWDMGFHDGIWHSKPDERFEHCVVYMRGWKYAKDN